MCICADNVKEVSCTKIISFHVGYSLDKKPIIPGQLVVYSATVESLTNSNAFILPVYNPGNDPSQIIPLDFSELSSFVDDVEAIFNRWFPSMKAQSYNFSNSSESRNSNTLEVYTVGDYKFSIMPTKYDFNRVDKNQLNVNAIAKTAIDVHPDNYSFIVYQFYQRGKLNITPFGYICPPFDNSKMVIPTIHGHPHDMLPNIGTGYIPNMFVPYNSGFENQADFDHEIYSLAKNPGENSSNNKQDVMDIDKLLKTIDTDYMQRKIRIYCPLKFVPNKIKLTGNKMNRNILINYNEINFIRDLLVDRRGN